MVHLTVETVYGDRIIDVQCPECGSVYKFLLKDILNVPFIFECNQCNKKISITTLDSLKQIEDILMEAEQSLNNLQIEKMIKFTRLN